MAKHISAALIGIFLLAAVSQALANVDQAFVAKDGNDQGDCARNAPCRTFAYALSQANPGAEITAVDAAEYGPLVVTKSVSISASETGIAVITAGATGFGVEIKAAAGDNVRLNNLHLLNGGINVVGAASVEVGHTTVAGSPEYGLVVASPTRVLVSDSTFSNNFNIGIKQENENSNLALNRVIVTGSGASGGVYTNGQSEIINCTISNTGAGGLAVHEKANTFVKGTLITANRDGLQVLGQASVDTTIVSGNGTGVFNSGTLITYRNNIFSGNGQRDIYGPVPPTAKSLD